MNSVKESSNRRRIGTVSLLSAVALRYRRLPCSTKWFIRPFYSKFVSLERMYLFNVWNLFGQIDNRSKVKERFEDSSTFSFIAIVKWEHRDGGNKVGRSPGTGIKECRFWILAIFRLSPFVESVDQRF